MPLNPATLKTPVRLWRRSGAPVGVVDDGAVTGATIERALARLRTWPDYQETRLVELPGLARETRLAAIHFKDESQRFGVGSFKPMGGGYAVAGVVARRIATKHHRPVTDPFDPTVRERAADITVACATDGNHGRAVAWGAAQLGCRAVVYLASHVSPYREQAIASYGAEVVRTRGNHDEAVRRAAADARFHGWSVISETANASDSTIATDILSGYGAILLETADQLGDAVPTHLFVQAGVGGLAAGVIRCADAVWSEKRPTIVSVEAETADCVHRSMAAGELVAVTGDLTTVMGGLAAGEVSRYAWPVLQGGLDAAMTVPDAAAVETMRLLAHPSAGDPPLVAGEAGVAGLAACLMTAALPEARERLGLTDASRILVIGTEGATDPELYQRLVGVSPAEVA